jgi:hypothetical protein
MSLNDKIDLTKRGGGKYNNDINENHINIKFWKEKYQCAGSFEKKRLPGSNSENSLGRPLSREQSQKHG